MWKLDRPTMCEMKARAADIVHLNTGLTARLEVRYRNGATRARADVLVLDRGVPICLVDISKSRKAPVSVGRLRYRTGLPVLHVPGYVLFTDDGPRAYLDALHSLLPAAPSPVVPSEEEGGRGLERGG